MQIYSWKFFIHNTICLQTTSGRVGLILRHLTSDDSRPEPSKLVIFAAVTNPSRISCFASSSVSTTCLLSSFKFSSRCAVIFRWRASLATSSASCRFILSSRILSCWAIPSCFSNSASSSVNDFFWKCCVVLWSGDDGNEMGVVCGSDSTRLFDDALVSTFWGIGSRSCPEYFFDASLRSLSMSGFSFFVVTISQIFWFTPFNAAP